MNRHALEHHRQRNVWLLVQQMKEDGVHDGIQLLQCLVADSAFVWGCVNVTSRASRQATTARPTGARVSVATDAALRRAVIHLRQAVPKDLDIKDAHQPYLAALGRVFAQGGLGRGALQTMVSAHLPEHLSDRYAFAVRCIRECLGERRPGALPRVVHVVLAICLLPKGCPPDKYAVYGLQRLCHGSVGCP